MVNPNMLRGAHLQQGAQQQYMASRHAVRRGQGFGKNNSSYSLSNKFSSRDLSSSAASASEEDDDDPKPGTLVLDRDSEDDESFVPRYVVNRAHDDHDHDDRGAVGGEAEDYDANADDDEEEERDEDDEEEDYDGEGGEKGDAGDEHEEDLLLDDEDGNAAKALTPTSPSMPSLGNVEEGAGENETATRMEPKEDQLATAGDARRTGANSSETREAEHTTFTPKSSSPSRSPKQLGSPGVIKNGSSSPAQQSNMFGINRSASPPASVPFVADPLAKQTTPPPNSISPTASASTLSATPTSDAGAAPTTANPAGDGAAATTTIAAVAVTSKAAAHWRKLKMANKVGHALKEVNEELKIFGVSNSNDDKTNWSALHTQDLRAVPLYILVPDGQTKLCWDCYVAFLLLYVLAFVPYRIAFLGDLPQSLSIFDTIVNTSFGVDLVLNFFTAYEKDGIVHWDMKGIARIYLKSFFIIDLIATLPFEEILSSATNNNDSGSGIEKGTKLTRLPRLMKLMRILRLLKLMRIYRLQTFLRKIETNYSLHTGFSRMLNIFFTVFMATHLVGCIWFFIGVGGDSEGAVDECTFEHDLEANTLSKTDGGWPCRKGYLSDDMSARYIASLYWAFQTLTTVGYGDIPAQGQEEQLFAMLMMLVGVSWYAYVVGSMSTIMSSFDKQNKQIRDKLGAVSTFVTDAKLPSELGKRIVSYFEYSMNKKNNGLFSYDADEILGELSVTLKNEVITHVERELIASIPFFKGKSASFVSDCIQLFQPIVVLENDFIIKEGTAADEMFFLIKGRCAVYYGKNKIKALVEGSYFGEIGCILGGIRRAGIKAVTNCELQSLTKRNLNNLLGEYPDVGDELKIVARRRMAQVRTSQTRDVVSSVKKLLEVRQRRQSEGVTIPKNLRLSDINKTIKEEDEEEEEEEEKSSGGLSSGSSPKVAAVLPLQKGGANLLRGSSSRNSGGGSAGVRELQTDSSPHLSPKPKLAREFSVTSAVLGDGHQKLSSKDIAKINEKALGTPSLEEHQQQPSKLGVEKIEHQLSLTSHTELTVPSSTGAALEAVGSPDAQLAVLGAGGQQHMSTQEFILAEVDRLVAAKMELITEMLLKSVEGNMLEMFNQIQMSQKKRGGGGGSGEEKVEPP